MKTMQQGWIRAAVLGALLWTGSMAAPQALAHDTPLPIAVTEGGSQVVAVSAGHLHSCAVWADAGAVCWGNNDVGQATPPPGAFLSVSAGVYHTCGVKTDGAVACWGRNLEGQAAAPTGTYLSVSAGSEHSCGVKTDGAVACWGRNSLGEATAPPGMFLSVSAGTNHTCGLRTDGTVVCWGLNADGETDAPPGAYLSVSVGANHSCGVKTDGAVACWGLNNFGQATAPSGAFLSVSAGWRHSCGVKTDGALACWGDNSLGKTDHVSEFDDARFLSVSAGYFHTCGVTEDSWKGRTVVACWGAGEDTFPPLQLEQQGQSAVPEAVQFAHAGFGQIAAGNAHACYLQRDGEIACWGSNDEGQATAPAGTFTQVLAGSGYSCAIGTAGGAATCWGRAPGATFINSVLDDFKPYRQLALGTQNAVCALAAGSGQGQQSLCVNESIGDHSDSVLAHNITSDYTSSLSQFASSSLCAVNADGTGVCRTVSGAASAANVAIPPGPWRRLESGLAHQCGLKANGTLECWGNNDEGQTTGVPTGLMRSFSVGWNHACAIRDNGQLACWGSNLNGQATPPAGTYVQVAAGNTFTCAIRSDGQRLCWGASPGNPLRLDPASLPDGAMGAAYSAQLSVSGSAVSELTLFAVVDGSLPPGLSLDENSGAIIGTPTTVGTFTFTIDAEGDGGFTATRDYTITIGDTTPPQIDYTLTALSIGSNGWYTGNATVTWNVVDPESAVTSSTGCDVTTLDSDTAGATFTCTATSSGGTSSKTTTSLKRDATPPTITAAATTAPNANGWYSGDVTIHFTCSDATSGVAGACPADVVLTASGSSSAQTIFDNAGNSATSNAVTVQIDKSAPNVGYAFAPPAPDGNNGWYRGDVGIDWSIGDAESGIASSNGCVDGMLSTDTAGASWTCSATNNAGLQASVTTATIKRDGTAPTLAPTVPSPLLRGQSYSASPNAADALSGLATATCGALDTSSLGSKSTSCTATDNAGNSNTVTLNYTVTTTCANDGYKGTQLTWCRNICENGLTGATLDTWIHRWVSRYRDLPYCQVAPQPQPN